MEDVAGFLVDTSDNTILSHRSSALVGSTLESAASDPLMQSVAEKLDAGDLETTILNGYQVAFEQVDVSNCAITSSSAWSGIKMCLAQQNSDGKESHDGLTDEKSAQIAADAVDGEGKQHKENADAAGNQIQHESDARVAEPVQNTAQRHAEVQERTDPAERPYKCSSERVPKEHIPDKVAGSKKTCCTEKAPQKTDPDGF
jgi:hypothetical protein